jgi:hypothetical protein
MKEGEENLLAFFGEPEFICWRDARGSYGIVEIKLVSS